jgi:hypothetical protein
LEMLYIVGWLLLAAMLFDLLVWANAAKSGTLTNDNAIIRGIAVLPSISTKQ